MPWIGTSFLSQSHLIFILVISALTGVCGKATNALNLTHVAPCYNADNLELAILMDESASIDHWNKKERYIIKELIRRLYEYFPNMKIAMAVYCDTPKHSGIQDRCFKPMSPLQPNVEWTYSAIDGLKTDCPSSGAHELGYVLGWVAHHWANFTPPSDVTVSRHLLFTVDQAIRSGTFMPNYDREDLLCDSSVDDSYLPFAGQVIRDANVRPIAMVGGSPQNMEVWTHDFMGKLGFYPGTYEAANFESGTDTTLTSQRLMNEIFLAACVPEPTGTPPTDPPLTTDPPGSTMSTAPTPPGQSSERPKPEPTTTGPGGSTTDDGSPIDEDEPPKSRKQSAIAIFGALGGFIVLTGAGIFYMWKSLPRADTVEGAFELTAEDGIGHEDQDQEMHERLNF